MTFNLNRNPVIECCAVCFRPECAPYYHIAEEAERLRRVEVSRRREEAERHRREEAMQVRAIAAAEPAEMVLLQRIEPPVEGGLILAGIASTRLWDSNATRSLGRLPRKMKRALPVPLLWKHEWDKKIGTMFEARATADELRFKAVVMPPGTDGYDADLLRRVWDDIGSGAAGAVSFAAKNVLSDGSWEPTELSVCPQGANPCARITRAAFPNGDSTGYAAVGFDEDLVRRATEKHQAAHAALRRRSRHALATVAPVQTRSDDLGADGIPVRTFRLAWKEGVLYERGDLVLDQGATWVAAEPNSDTRPGSTPKWRLVAKGSLGPKKEANYHALVGAP